MTFLKKLGQILSTATQIIIGYGPIVTGMIPGTKDDQIVGAIGDKLDLASQVIIGVEASSAALTSPLPGSEKARAATPAMLQILASLQVVRGRKMKDEAKGREIAARIGGDLADWLNNFED